MLDLDTSLKKFTHIFANSLWYILEHVSFSPQDSTYIKILMESKGYDNLWL